MQLSFVRLPRLLSIRRLTHRVCEGMSWFLPDVMSPIRSHLPQTFVTPQKDHLHYCEGVVERSFNDADAKIIKHGHNNGGRTFRREENWAVWVAVVTCLQKVLLDN